MINCTCFLTASTLKEDKIDFYLIQLAIIKPEVAGVNIFPRIIVSEEKID